MIILNKQEEISVVSENPIVRPSTIFPYDVASNVTPCIPSDVMSSNGIIPSDEMSSRSYFPSEEVISTDVMYDW